MNEFKVEQLWHDYLKMVGLNANKLPNIQRLEMKKSFFAGVGQILMLLRNDLASLPEEDRVEALNNLIEETKYFWITVSLPYNN